MAGPFTLYPEERHWWSFNDYGAVVDAMARLKASGASVDRVLEFGPGSSTLALIEGGAAYIDTLEDDPVWAKTYEERLQAKYPIVHVRRYAWSVPLTIPAVDGERYDLALIDGPLGSDRRSDALRYALDRCAAVLMPTEDRNRRVREGIEAIAAERGLHVDIRETGPLSGGFALVTRPREDADGVSGERQRPRDPAQPADQQPPGAGAALGPRAARRRRRLAKRRAASAVPERGED